MSPKDRESLPFGKKVTVFFSSAVGNEGHKLSNVTIERFVDFGHPFAMIRYEDKHKRNRVVYINMSRVSEIAVVPEDA